MVRRVTTISSLAGFLCAVGATLYVLTAPVYASMSTSAENATEGVVVVERRTSAVEASGPRIVVLTTSVTMIAGLPLLFALLPVPGRAVAMTLPALLLLAFSVIAGFSIGLFYMPSALILLAAAFASLFIREPSTPTDGSGRAAGRGLMALLAVAATASPGIAQDPSADLPRPEDTEVWEPVPAVVSPGPVTGSVAPPSDAIVLFDGDGLDEWLNVRDRGPAGWSVEGGAMTVDKSVGDIETRRAFRDYQLHIEWRVSEHITGAGQDRGNSGLFLAWDAERSAGYELQIVDSYENPTYVNGMAGSIYKQAIPLVNAARPPGEWQSYEVLWTAPRFAPDGSLEAPARVTVLYNGVLVQDDFELTGETLYRGTPSYHPYERAPLMLQAHDDPSPPISFRNIWIREIER